MPDGFDVFLNFGSHQVFAPNHPWSMSGYVPSHQMPVFDHRFDRTQTHLQFGSRLGHCNPSASTTFGEHRNLVILPQVPNTILVPAVS